MFSGATRPVRMSRYAAIIAPAIVQRTAIYSSTGSSAMTNFEALGTRPQMTCSNAAMRRAVPVEIMGPRLEYIIGFSLHQATGLGRRSKNCRYRGSAAETHKTPEFQEPQFQVPQLI